MSEHPILCPDCRQRRPIRAPLTKACATCTAHQLRLNQRNAYSGDDYVDEVLEHARKESTQ